MRKSQNRILMISLKPTCPKSLCVIRNNLTLTGISYIFLLSVIPHIAVITTLQLIISQWLLKEIPPCLRIFFQQILIGLLLSYVLTYMLKRLKSQSLKVFLNWYWHSEKTFMQTLYFLHCHAGESICPTRVETSFQV